ncbi:diguanylate cyclase (GGDEF) domain-containing protein [Alkalibacterium subtropicum]|uniref:Diguanylate cyclase (GGDEF) domain-containing protein n=1 Tax=Alkalibacterium subtropicum TaxID=753702 RepID=A0A1I1IZM7_9LACT|nr:sensor domain-containing diguanylate cyclase [Alkalibacterium subtropicum]SFC41152.1 diguanylate cyclase (GGDEF) domain-containing protein [Alkalibacterium subtropicum]
MVNDKKRFAIWAFFIPIALFILGTAYYIHFYVSPFLTIDYAFFLKLAVLIGLFPIKTEDSILFLVTGISLPVLIIYGLIPEIIVSSIAIIFLMLRSDIKFDQHYRYPLNLLMFHFLSVISAGFYYLTLQLLDSVFNIITALLALTVYMFAHLIFNQLSMYIVEKYFYENADAKVIDDNLTFSFYSTLFVIPLSFIIIYLYEMTGTMGILIGALPFLTVTIGTNFYYKSKVHNKYLKRMNQFSQELNAKKNGESVIEIFIQALVQIFPSDAISYFTVENEAVVRREKMIVGNGEIIEKNELFHLSEESMLRRAMTSDTMLSHCHSKDWKVYCTNDIAYHAESALVMPVKVMDRTQGIILMTHHTRSIYDDMMVSLVEVFHKYFSIALDNAHHYEQLEETAEKDFLTDLPNLKGLSKQLQKVKDRGSVGQMSLIVLDLDHFKLVNDTHGHQSGNEILSSLAKRLRNNLSDSIYVARFGGEEFIILLPYYTEEAAFAIAEEVRQLIADTPFKISESMQSNRKEKVFVTASLGLATCKDGCMDIEELIHLADRAMYIGSKQKGRNRVTVAQKGS